ncbi:26S protease-like protein regulatory subunit 6B, partial [Aureobasidium melanogenum]
MADTAVDSYANTVPPHKKQLSSSIPNIESLEGIGADSDDQYSTFKKLQRQLEYIKLQEEYIKDEQRSLKRELVRAQEEIKRIQSVPLVIGQFMEAIDQNTGIVQSSTGSNYVVRILSTLDRELLKPSSSVALHRHSNSLVDILPPEADSSIAMLGADEKPDISYADRRLSCPSHTSISTTRSVLILLVVFSFTVLLHYRVLHQSCRIRVRSEVSG